MMQDVFEKLQFDSEKFEVLLKYNGHEVRIRDPIKIIFNGDFKPHHNDCLPVAVALFFNKPYEEAYLELANEAITQRALFNNHGNAKRYLTGMGLKYHDILNKRNIRVSLWDFIAGSNNWLYHSDTLFLTNDHVFVVRDGIVYTTLGNDDKEEIPAVINALDLVFNSSLYSMYTWPADHYE